MSVLNTRKDLQAGSEDSGLDELAASIRGQGLLNPLILRPRDDGRHEIVAGQRQYLACRRLGMKTVVAVVKLDMDDDEVVVTSLVENVHRAEMNPMDKARAYRAIGRHGAQP